MLGCHSKRWWQADAIPRVGIRSWWFSSAQAKQNFVNHGRDIIREGYFKYKESMFVVQTTDIERVVVGVKYARELNAYPESVLSTRKAMSKRHLGKYTAVDVILTSTLQNDICRVQLTQNLSTLVPIMREEAVYWVTRTVMATQHGEGLPAQNSILHITAGISSRVFIGFPACRHPKWIETSIGYTRDVFRVSTALQAYPEFVRPLVVRWLDCTKQLDERLRTAELFLNPIFAGRLTERLQKQTNDKANHDLIQWMVDACCGEDSDPSVLTRKIMFLTLAAIHTTTMSVTHAIFDLCAMPYYIEHLRQEISEVTSKHGWSLLAINDFKLLDSFVKESQRVNHPGLLSFNRKVLKTLYLSDGRRLPAGTFISMPTEAVAHDPVMYSNPDTFDGYRYYHRRQDSTSGSQQHQFSSIGSNNLAFGYGKSACPGRFFASAQIKMIIATIIMSYDISFPNNCLVRPPNVYSGERIGPNPTQTVVFTRRV
ncbi:cytochrome P450 [Xylaria sp. FL1777]|nr:cytochrome P450 [Xylaria sp. FL1777]